MAGGGDGYAMLKGPALRAGGYCRDNWSLDLDLLVEAFKTQSPLVRRVEGARGPVTFSGSPPGPEGAGSTDSARPNHRAVEPIPSIARSNRRTSS